VISNFMAIDPDSTIKTARLELNTSRGTTSGGDDGGEREESSKKGHPAIPKISWEGIVDSGGNVGDVERFHRGGIEMGIHRIKGSAFLTAFRQLGGIPQSVQELYPPLPPITGPVPRLLLLLLQGRRGERGGRRHDDDIVSS